MFLFLLVLGFLVAFASLLAAKSTRQLWISWGVLIGSVIVLAAFLVKG